MNVSQIMVVDPVTVSDDAALQEAARLMDENAIRHLPVVRGDALVGVVSELDLLASRQGHGSRSVRDVLHAEPATVLPEDSIAQAVEQLARSGLGCLPVTRRDALVGFLTESDVLDALVGASYYGRLGNENNPPVSECMSGELVTTISETSVEDARRTMRDRRFRHLPITNEQGRLVGIVGYRELSVSALPDSPVGDLVRHAPSTAAPEEPLARAADRMHRERIDALPVVDERERLVGILSIRDVLAHCAQVLA